MSNFLVFGILEVMSLCRRPPTWIRTCKKNQFVFHDQPAHTRSFWQNFKGTKVTVLKGQFTPKWKKHIILLTCSASRRDVCLLPFNMKQLEVRNYFLVVTEKETSVFSQTIEREVWTLEAAGSFCASSYLHMWISEYSSASQQWQMYWIFIVLLQLATSSSFMLLCLTSSFTAIIITTDTRGRHRARALNVGHNKLLSQSTSMVAFLTRTRCHWELLVSGYLL